ncbi:MAG: radical SAM protein [Treponema sp.]|jgi:radical SAM superfamily enzyme YgiQ (UPF0313 family)|nr:radical SAM protein [Treponema sp.]
MTARIILVQPPFVQLNSPYPSIYYLRSFLEQRGYPVIVRDHSIALFEKIFCRNGLERIFNDIRDRFDSGGLAGLDKQTISHVERFLTDEGRWLSSIDSLVAFLRGQNHEWGHLLALANGALPEGVRFYRHLAERYPNGGDVPVDKAPLLASFLLADIAGLVTQTLDGHFSLIRYATSTARDGFAGMDEPDGGPSLDGYIMKHFYRPLLEAEWNDSGAFVSDGGSGCRPVLGITIPFPGCLCGAMVCADSAKRHFGGGVTTIAGGGYVNTELRFIEEERFFRYFDYLAFDRGYGALEAIIQKVTAKETAGRDGSTPLYKTMYLNVNNIIKSDSINNNCNNKSIDINLSAGYRTDDEAARLVFPDYSGVDFSRYIRPVDDVNPMHRLWSDGRWIKAYTAHGCYWHNCAFCDVSLDYINAFRPVDIDALFRHLTAQAQASGTRGIHLVDEACPPASLLRLALLNREAGLPLLFWGNIRFEKAFTPDMAAVLAAGGLIGVSAGIEIASEKGFARIGKGIDLRGTVEACAAFKEAGILVHAYLIYGYWDEDAGEIIDSAETLRQFFAAGLLDSAFWHQFVLTKHSRVYAEKMAGRRPELRPNGGVSGGGKKIFALNDIHFDGEEQFGRYTAPLDRLLQSWMAGDTSRPVTAAFSFKVPNPSAAPELVLTMLDTYAKKRGKSRTELPQNGAKQAAVFLGSRPLVRPAKNGAELWWRWRFEDCTLRPQAKTGAAWAEKTAALLNTAARGNGLAAGELFNTLQNIFGEDAERMWKQLRKQGLAIVNSAGTTVGPRQKALA